MTSTPVNVTGLTSGVPNFRMKPESPDSPILGQDETRYNNPGFLDAFSYYKGEAPLQAGVDAIADYVTGKGYETDPETRVILDHISGDGKETFDEISHNMIIGMLLNKGGSFCQIIREGDKPTGLLLNMKVLNPERVVVIFGADGRIKRYEIENAKAAGGFQKLERWQVFHLRNNKVFDEMGATTIFDACKWIIDARREAMEDWRRISHRSTIRILYVDIGNSSRNQEIRTQYKEGIAKGEVLILPMKKGDAEFADLTLPPVEAFLSWIRYTDNLIYQAIRVPKVVIGGSEEFTEASSKTAVLTFNQTWEKLQKKYCAAFWNQVGLRITYNAAISLKNEMLSDEAKNTGQTRFQPNDFTANSGADGSGM